MCNHSEFIETTGRVLETLPNTTFKVKINNGAILSCYIAGKIAPNPNPSG